MLEHWNDLRTLYIDRNLSVAEIGAMKSRTPGTVLAQLKRQDIPIKPKNWRRMKHLDFTPAPALSYLIGALLGDGWVQRDGDRIEFHVASAAFAGLVEDALRACGLTPTTRPQGAPGPWTTRAKSQSFCRWWHASDRLAVLDIGLMHVRDFIQGLFDAEGSVFQRARDTSPRIAIDCPESQAMAATLGALRALGYRCTTHTTTLPSGVVMYRIAIQVPDHVHRFLSEFPSTVKML